MAESNALPRHKRLNSSRKNKQKRNLLNPYISGNVLHLGCRADGYNHSGFWLHEWLCQRADLCVGVDIDEDAVKGARDNGYNIRHGNVETIEMDREFDVVVATNIIEHLTCPGEMLDRASESLKNDGHLLLTTPRTFAPWNLARDLKGGIETPDEHVMWFCRDTLTTMLNRHDFGVAHYESWGWRRVGTVWYEEVFHTVENLLAHLPYLERITDYQHFFVAKKLNSGSS